jgi:tyrosyl-tRNA synthetase
VAPLMSIFRGIVDIFPEILPADFLAAPKRVKLGFDPTSDCLHLGHSILLRKLSEFQNAGHKPVIIIGDFTARIGDPTGKSKTRKQLSKEEVDENIDKFFATICKFIDVGNAEFVFNSSHLNSLTLSEIIKLQSTFTVNQLLAKQDFRDRFNRENPIGLHEMMYPLLQGFDSFVVNSDIELGGVDQKFNVSIGRVIQKQFDSDSQQVGMLMPILSGTDGKEKMSKSLNNTIGLDEHPLNMFSKLEKIPDNVVDDFILLLTDLDMTNLPSNPREKQKLMAVEVVSTIHGEEEAKKALKNSEAIIVSGETEVIAEEIAFEENMLPILLANLLKEINFTKSTSVARRLISSGAIKIDGEKITDEKHTINNFGQLFQVSRKSFFRLIEK